MWIMTNKGMLSIVAHRADPNILLVRSRDLNALDALFPDLTAHETPTADYRFRVTATRKRVKQLMAEQIDAIDYDNFKRSVTDLALHSAYVDVWGVMHRYQTRRYGPAPHDLPDWQPWFDSMDDHEEQATEAPYPVGWPMRGIQVLDDNDADWKVG